MTGKREIREEAASKYLRDNLNSFCFFSPFDFLLYIFLEPS